jgi:hypothetical protein
MLDVNEPVTTGELADPLDVSIQTLRNHEAYFAGLETADIIQREDLGAGRAMEWRICLSLDGEEAGSRASTPIPAVDTDADGPQFSDVMAVIAEVLYDMGHRKIDLSGELTLAVTGHGDRLSEWLGLHLEVRQVLSLVAHLQGTMLETMTGGTDSARYQPPKSVTLGLDPAPETPQTSLVASANYHRLLPLDELSPESRDTHVGIR